MHTTTTTPAPVLSVGALLPVSPAYRAVLTKVDTGEPGSLVEFRFTASGRSALMIIDERFRADGAGPQRLTPKEKQ